MVVFTCQNCGDSLKKTAVDKHYHNTKCRFQRPNLTCVDCLKDFFDQDYSAHTECVTEAERYSAKGAVFKEKAGKAKQQKYVDMIQNLLNSKDLNNTQRKLLDTLSRHQNVPRKEAKFLNFMKNVEKRAKLEDFKSVFKLLQDSWIKEEQANVSAAAVNKTPVSDNTDDNPNEIDQRCDKPRNKKSNKTNENNRSLEEVDENTIKNNSSIDESKENVHGMSKKQLKKQKKHQQYLLELENEEMSNVNEAKNNVGCAMEVEETTNKSYEKKNKKLKKSKKAKIKSDEIDSLENGAMGNNDEMEVNFTEEKVSKKDKKRKLVDSIPEIAEKKNKLDSSEGGEDIQQSFSWGEVIIKVLQSRPDHELSLKRLGKKVIQEYQSVRADHHTYEQLLAKFNKKVKKTSGVRVLKDKAKLIE